MDQIITLLVAIIIILSLDFLNGIVLTLMTAYYKTVYVENLSGIRKEVKTSMAGLNEKFQETDAKLDSVHQTWLGFVEQLIKMK